MKLLNCSILILMCSCSTVRLNPDWYAGDHLNESIISSKGHRITCDDPKLDNFAALHKEDINELREVLRQYKKAIVLWPFN